MKTIELFAGAGGLGMGIHQAGFDPVMMLEWNHWCCETLRENLRSNGGPIAPWEVLEGDVRNVDFRQHEGVIDLVSGGPPCQPFSLGGKHKGYQDDRDMFPEAVRAVREIKPKAFMFENVKGLTRASFASYLEYIKLQLEYPNLTRKPKEEWARHLGRLEDRKTKGSRSGLRYNVVVRVLNAANYGVPQKRERVFFVGIRSDLGIEWHFPEGQYSKAALDWEKSTNEYWDRLEVPKNQRIITKKPSQKGPLTEMKPWRTVREALHDLPDPEKKPKAAKNHQNHLFQAGAKSYPGHTGSPLDEPAKTLKAGVHGVPGGENMLRRSDGSVRYFSVRESARLQTFPDDFALHGSWSEAMRQLGNAVPVTLAKVIAQNLQSHLGGLARE